MSRRISMRAALRARSRASICPSSEGRARGGDVDGSEIPRLYHDYVKRGEPHRLVPVFHHNLLDVVAMVELTPPIFDSEVGVY